MDRIIKLNRLQAAVDGAYEKFKSLEEGVVDPAYGNPDPKLFGITLMLADGTEISKGDTMTPFVLGSLAKVPLSVELLSQNTPDELLKKSGRGCCCCDSPKKPKDLPVSAHGVRAVSAVEPVGDPDGKMDVITSRIIALVGSAPVLNDKVYESRLKAAADGDTVNRLAEAGYNLYDDAEASIDIYTRLESLQLTTRQLAAMGAAIAADGRQPETGVPAFDGAIAQQVVAMMAVHGPHKMRSWLLKAGLPAKSGRGGGMLAVLPGVMAIAAYSPALNEVGTSVKAARAIAYIAHELDINVFASAKVRIEK